jgi:hypothetical protein
MSAKADLLETRFRLNMSRISGLVRLLSSHEALKPSAVFGTSSGARAGSHSQRVASQCSSDRGFFL